MERRRKVSLGARAPAIPVKRLTVGDSATSTFSPSDFLRQMVDTGASKEAIYKYKAQLAQTDQSSEASYNAVEIQESLMSDVCAPKYDSLKNGDGMNPCIMGAKLISQCKSESEYIMMPLNAKQGGKNVFNLAHTYPHPTSYQTSDCMCNRITFNMIQACSQCQTDDTFSSDFGSFMNQCTSLSESWPEHVSKGGVDIPSWATRFLGNATQLDDYVSDYGYSYDYDSSTVNLSSLFSGHFDHIKPQSVVTSAEGRTGSATSNFVPLESQQATTSSDMSTVSYDGSVSGDSKGTKSSGSMSTGARAGIVVGCVVAALIVCAFIFRYRKRLFRSQRRDSHAIDRADSMGSLNDPVLPTSRKRGGFFSKHSSGSQPTLRDRFMASIDTSRAPASRGGRRVSATHSYNSSADGDRTPTNDLTPVQSRNPFLSESELHAIRHSGNVEVLQSEDPALLSAYPPLVKPSAAMTPSSETFHQTLDPAKTWSPFVASTVPGETLGVTWEHVPRGSVSRPPGSTLTRTNTSDSFTNTLTDRPRTSLTDVDEVNPMSLRSGSIMTVKVNFDAVSETGDSSHMRFSDAAPSSSGPFLPVRPIDPYKSTRSGRASPVSLSLSAASSEDLARDGSGSASRYYMSSPAAPPIEADELVDPMPSTASATSTDRDPFDDAFATAFPDHSSNISSTNADYAGRDA